MLIVIKSFQVESVLQGSSKLMRSVSTGSQPQRRRACSGGDTSPVGRILPLFVTLFYLTSYWKLSYLPTHIIYDIFVIDVYKLINVDCMMPYIINLFSFAVFYLHTYVITVFIFVCCPLVIRFLLQILQDFMLVAMLYSKT